MKVLHTSDWHLGQKFLHYDREEEHQLALDFLLDCIQSEQIDLLIVAGDIFDIGNPPNYARRMYYQFLTDVMQSSCKHIVIVGGNHDSPAMLNAPSNLLRTMNIHIIGSATGQLEDELIELRSKSGELEAVVAAVPFLRDRDLHYSTAGEGGAERIDRVKKGIFQHYREMATLVERYQAEVPIIATGHLYAMGAEASDRQDNIYIGDKENIRADQFAEVFDYVALGHIHRPQAVGGVERIRYCGSLIPLSFSETKDEKSISIIEFNGKNITQISEKKLPVFRRLKTIQGNLDEVKQKLRKFAEKEGRGLPPWVEIIIETDQLLPRLDIELRTFVKDMDLDLLKIRVQRSYQALDQQIAEPDLENLETIDVFRKKCSSYGTAIEDIGELELVFKELQNWLKEQAKH